MIKYFLKMEFLQVANRALQDLTTACFSSPTVGHSDRCMLIALCLSRQDT